jgi:hypothetical protein
MTIAYVVNADILRRVLALANAMANTIVMPKMLHCVNLTIDPTVAEDQNPIILIAGDGFMVVEENYPVVASTGSLAEPTSVCIGREGFARIVELLKAVGREKIETATLAFPEPLVMTVSLGKANAQVPLMDVRYPNCRRAFDVGSDYTVGKIGMNLHHLARLDKIWPHTKYGATVFTWGVRGQLFASPMTRSRTHRALVMPTTITA